MSNLNVVIGLGKTGLSCVKFCLQKNWPVAVTDACEHPPCASELQQIAPNIRKEFGQISPTLINDAKQLIISPGISLQEPAIAHAIGKGMPYLGDIELFVQHVNAPIVAITGSNAKSTITAMVGEMGCQAGINTQVAGNIGIPVLDLLNQATAKLYILELSSFQLETTHSLHAKVATVLNICADHMNRYHNLQEYIAAKMKIYQNCEQAVINRGASFHHNLIHYPQIKKVISFGLDKPKAGQYGLIETRNNIFLARGNTPLLNVNQLKLPGQHNIENALAALAIGAAAGIDKTAMLQTLQNFTGLPHRCQLVCQHNQINWYNDSKGTNVGATIAAITGLGGSIPGKIILIAGGLGKNADFKPLQNPVKQFVRKVILIGAAAAELQEALQNCSVTTIATSLQHAVKLAKNAAQSGDIVLLSPACASFDMFNNYEQRGEEFMRIVYDTLK